MVCGEVRKRSRSNKFLPIFIFLEVFVLVDEKVIERVIEEFHKDYFPEVRVVFLGEGKDGVLAFRFDGHFCYTCGLEDYFDDFATYLERHIGKKFVILEKLPEGDEDEHAWVIIYKPASEKDLEKVGEEKKKVRYIVLTPNGDKEEWFV